MGKSAMSPEIAIADAVPESDRVEIGQQRADCARGPYPLRDAAPVETTSDGERSRRMRERCCDVQTLPLMDADYTDFHWSSTRAPKGARPGHPPGRNALRSSRNTICRLRIDQPSLRDWNHSLPIPALALRAVPGYSRPSR
jgi:hypothetical protein